MAVTVQIHMDFAADGLAAPAPAEVDKALARIRRRVCSTAPAVDWVVSKLIGVQGSAPDTGQDIGLLGRQLRDAIIDGLGPQLARRTPIRVQVRRSGTLQSPATAGGPAPETYTIG